ncbi:MAG: hypothetical protein LBL50_02820, partial [Candidatus Margulisbacteria bacterium]|nr:hypothetical protein [Candidatus Margulisiibacteriota bacterium]
MAIERGQPLLASDINNLTFFPIGAILQFSGSQYTRLTSARTADDKVIWTLCNGTAVNGITVPNLVDKFLRGAASPDTTGGGTATLTTANLPSHGHDLSGLAISSSDGGHTHTNNITATIATDSGVHSHEAGSLACPVEGGSHGHELSITSVTGGTHEHSVSGSTNSTNDAAGTAAKSLTGTAECGEQACSTSGILSWTGSGHRGWDYGHADNPHLYIDATHSHGITGTAASTNSGHSHTIAGSVSGNGTHGHSVGGSTSQTGSGHSHTVTIGGTIGGPTDGTHTHNISGGTIGNTGSG